MDNIFASAIIKSDEEAKMTYTITIQNADDNIIKLLKGFLKLMPNIHFSVKNLKTKTL